MTTTVSTFPNVRERLRTLGCNEPSGFAILPSNFTTARSIEDFHQVSEAATVKTLLRSADLPFSDLVHRSQRPSYSFQKSIEWIAPIMFLSQAVAENSELLSLALDAIRDHLMHLFNGLASRNATLDIVAETNAEGSCKRVRYEGPVEGIGDVARVVESLRDD